MKRKPYSLFLLGAATGGLWAADPSFTYHGRLTENGTPPTASYDFKFTLRERQPGNQSWGPRIRENVNVSDGEFDVMLDFPTTAFRGNDLQLDIEARVHPAAGDPPYKAITPSVALTPVPYAITALNTPPGSITAQQIAPNQVVKTINGTAADAITFVPGSGVTIAPPTADGRIVISANGGGGGGTGWSLAGNSGTQPGLDFIGTLDGAPVEVRANSRRIASFSYAPGSSDSPPRIVLGHPSNSARRMPDGAEVESATIGGGGIGGVLTLGANLLQVGGSNVVSGNFGTVAGGIGNGAGVKAVVSGGVGNVARGDHSVIVGGLFNRADGDGATIVGGVANMASGANALAAGYGANANRNGSFVWASGLEPYGNEFLVARYQPSDANSFNVFAPKGVYFDLGGPGIAEPQSDGTVTTGKYSVLFGPTSFPGELIHTSTGAHLTKSGTWANASDRARKADFEDVDPRSVLELLKTLPIRRWRYTNEDGRIRHLGPVAQDFRAAFGLGNDDKSITTVDADGVALAAIQGLHRMLVEKDAEVTALKRQVAELEGARKSTDERLAQIERTLNRIAGQKVVAASLRSDH